MEKKDLLAKVKTAQEIAETAKEPYKLEAFKITLAAMLVEPDRIQRTALKQVAVLETQPSKSKLADLCRITVEQLANVYDILGNKISLIAPLQGTEPEKQTDGSLCILAANEVILGGDWLDSKLLAEGLAGAGVGSLDHLARALKSEPDLFRWKGSTGNTMYKLTSPAKTRAFSLIRQLATGQPDNPNVHP